MKQTILLVDDEADLVELVAFNLRGAGFRVLTAGRGDEAIQLALAERPDLILLDLMLPELDGYGVCEYLRREPSTADIPIVILSAWANEQSRILGFELGADDYVTKPFSPRELVLRVSRRLGPRSVAA